MSDPALPTVAASSPGAAAHFDAGTGLLTLEGRLTIARAAALEPRLAALLESHAGPVRINLAGVERMDTVGAWLVHRILRDRPGSLVDGASDRATRLIAEVADADQACAMRPDLEPFVTRELRKLGRYMFAFWHMILAVLGFVGTTLVAAWTAISSRRGVRWGAVTVQMEQTGVNALGIVGLMSFLIGIVLAQQGAVQLQQFGAEVFVINLVGRATFREMGILLTAIMIAGRSASAFAAQIGSMKLAEEVDAMRTIGLDPVEVLVLPRVIALILMMPLLAFYASLLSVIGGGLFAWVSLDIPPATFVQRLREVVPMSDFWIGLSKAPVFGAIIAIIGCFQGFQVTDTAESVGMRTTLAVVQAIFVVIVLDAFFAVFYSALGFN
jgi:phospholipid/cholesterol/gamma-HCH transport system permease protein